MAAPIPHFNALVEAEHDLSQRLMDRLETLPPHPNEALDATRTLGERVADRVAAIAGSWTFILIFLLILASWMAINVSQGTGAFDPYPFILLNLMLSTVAALQAPVIMMSQNRAAARDRAQADMDYRVNVRAEAEIAALKIEMEDLRRQQMVALLAVQQEQLTLLRHILESRGDGSAMGAG